MTTYNPDPATIRAEIKEVATNENHDGLYLSSFYGSTLDGSDVAQYLESIGLPVLSYRDTGRCGLVTLACGVQVSTNGAAIRTPGNWCVVYRTNECAYQYKVSARTTIEAQSKAFSRFWRDHMDTIRTHDYELASATLITQ